jgi:excisionase family DNA binding protein
MNDRDTEGSGIPPLAVMTVREISDYLRVHPSTIYKLLRGNRIPAFRVGSDWRFRADVIDGWCSRKEAEDPRLRLAQENKRSRLVLSP